MHIFYPPLAHRRGKRGGQIVPECLDTINTITDETVAFLTVNDKVKLFLTPADQVRGRFFGGGDRWPLYCPTERRIEIRTDTSRVHMGSPVPLDPFVSSLAPRIFEGPPLGVIVPFIKRAEEMAPQGPPSQSSRNSCISPSCQNPVLRSTGMYSVRSTMSGAPSSSTNPVKTISPSRST